ncbi:TrkH family potassium uptake protein, partial [Paracoccus aestuarii]
MIGFLQRLPVLVILAAVTALMMMIPAANASVAGHAAIARNFFYAGLLILVFCGLIGIATQANPRPPRSRATLLTMLGVYGILPPLMALPFAESLPDTGFFNAWWEMVSSLTTTGASLYSADLLPMPLHLWRAVVGSDDT